MDAIPAAPSGCALLGQQLAAEPRLQRRYQALVASQLSPAQSLAAGIRVPAGLASGFAATQAAWRFFANPRLTRPGRSSRSAGTTCWWCWIGAICT